MIPGNMYSACPYRQFFTLPGLLDSWAEQRNSYPKACVPSREAICTIIIMIFGMTRSGREPATYRMRSAGHAITTRKRRMIDKGVKHHSLFLSASRKKTHTYLPIYIAHFAFYFIKPFES